MIDMWRTGRLSTRQSLQARVLCRSRECCVVTKNITNNGQAIYVLKHIYIRVESSTPEYYSHLFNVIAVKATNAF